MQTHLVTGGAGFIGSHLVRRLLADGHRVVVLDNFDTGSRENLAGLDLELVEGDLRDLPTVRRCVEGVHTVFHLGAIASVPRSIEDPVQSFDVDVRGSHHVFEAARQAGVQRVVCASSAAVYGENPAPRLGEHELPAPVSPYGAHKAMMEDLARASSHSLGLPVVCLRFFNVYGARQDPRSSYAGVIAAFLGVLSQGGVPTVHGDGGQSRDFVHVSDVVEALLLGARHGEPGRAYNVGTGQPTSVLELLRTIQAQLGGSDEVHFGPARPGDLRTSCADIASLQGLGFHPTRTLVEGLAETATWYLEQAR